MNPAPHPIGLAAATYMDAFRVTRARLAEGAGVARSTLTRWFNGTHPIPLDSIPRLEQVLGLPRGRLLLDAGYVDSAANVAFESAT